MSTINALFYVNFAIFSIFLTLFLTELMGAVLLLVAYDRAKSKVLPYVVPIWEVTGTFAVLWVVTADFAYPSMLIPVASLFAGLIVVFLILIVARNASISFAELITKRGWLDERRLYRAYAVSTLAIAVVVVSLLSAIVSGAGVDLTTLSFSVTGWLGNPASVLYVLGVVVIAVGLAPVFYDVEGMRRLTLPLTVVGVLIEASALYLYTSSFLSATFLIPALLTIMPALLYQSRRTAAIVTHKLVFATVATLIVFSLSYLVYPTAFHGGITVDAVTTSGPMVGAFYILSAAGVVFIGLLMALYLTAVRRSTQHLSRGPSPPAPATPASHDP